MKLYASQYGGRYHRDPGCGMTFTVQQRLPNGWPPISRLDAVRRQLTPCRFCAPPPLLVVMPANPEEW